MDILYILMSLVNLLIDLTIFPHLGYEYDIVEDIVIKIATKTLLIFLLFLFTLCSLYIYQKDKNVVKMNSFYVASDKHSYKFLLVDKKKRKKDRIYC